MKKEKTIDDYREEFLGRTRELRQSMGKAFCQKLDKIVLGSLKKK